MANLRPLSLVLCAILAAACSDSHSTEPEDAGTVLVDADIGLATVSDAGSSWSPKASAELPAADLDAGLSAGPVSKIPSAKIDAGSGASVKLHADLPDGAIAFDATVSPLHPSAAPLASSDVPPKTESAVADAAVIPPEPPAVPSDAGVVAPEPPRIPEPPLIPNPFDPASDAAFPMFPQIPELPLWDASFPDLPPFPGLGG